MTKTSKCTMKKQNKRLTDNKLLEAQTEKIRQSKILIQDLILDLLEIYKFKSSTKGNFDQDFFDNINNFIFYNKFFKN